MNDGFRLGPYVVKRELESGRFGTRWLAVHDRSQDTHVLYCLAGFSQRSDQRRFVSAFHALNSLDDPHILPVSEFAFDHDSNAWAVLPYTGNQDGLIQLSHLLEAKGGSMPAVEAQRAVTHLLGAIEHARSKNVHHGLLDMSDILVDRHGRLRIELFGFAVALGRNPPAADEKDEVRSAIQIAYTLVTGLPADEPLIPVGAVVKRLDPAFEEWVERGLDPAGGFASPAEALDALPGRRKQPDSADKQPVMRTVLRRVTSKLRSE